MATISQHRVGAIGRRTRKRRGAMLVLLLFFIVLSGSLATLMMAGTAQFVRTNRHAHESILQRQIADSGLAWARAHPERQRSTPITFRADDLLPEGTSGTVTIAYPAESGDVLSVTVYVRFAAGSVTRTFRFVHRAGI